MSKLAKKFLFSISIILISIIFFTLLINSKFIERYYLYEKKIELENIYIELKNNLENIDETIRKIELSNKVVIAKVVNNNDNDIINKNLRSMFLKKGLGIEKFWLWDKDYDSAISKGRHIRIYNQGKLNYSLLVEYVSLGNEFLGIAMIIPDMTEMLKMINYLTTLIFSIATFFIIILIYFLVKKITTPLEKINSLAKDISNQDFKTINIKTNDEIETLANSINNMSIKLQQAQKSLTLKNQQMELLLSNVSHDLKTPISLIKAYVTGIKDNLDDGTFLDTVISQNEKMDLMVERLLDLSRIQQKQLNIESFDISSLLETIIKEHIVIMKTEHIDCIQEIEQNIIIKEDKNDVSTIFMNFIMNAIKYNTNNEIKIYLKKNENNIFFKIINTIDFENKIEIERVWEPFYVGETSRNKKLSGTGLGLSIVSAISQKHGIDYGCLIQGKEIVFYINFVTWM